MSSLIPTPNIEYSLEEMDGEILLYSPNETRTIYLNESASLVWQLCNGERSVDEILEILTEAFPETDNLHQDIANCLDQLSSDGAITLNHSA